MPVFLGQRLRWPSVRKRIYPYYARPRVADCRTSIRTVLNREIPYEYSPDAHVEHVKEGLDDEQFLFKRSFGH